MQQLSLSLEPGLAVRFRDLRECFAHCVYRVGLGKVAAAVDQAPSNLSAMLSGDRHLDTGIVERYMEAFHDSTPARYLAARWLNDPEMVKAFALAQLPDALNQLATMLHVAGVELPKQGRARR